MTLFPNNESKNYEKYKELWSKTKDLIKSKTDDDDDEKYMKMKLNSDDDLPLKKTRKLHNMITVVKIVSHEDEKYYPKFSWVNVYINYNC